MQTSKQARHSSFQRGQGSFCCRSCDRKTRDTGDNGQVQLCPECYELAGMENLQSDNGSLGNYAEAAQEYLNRLAEKVGIEKAEACFPSIVSELQQVDAPAQDMPLSANPASVKVEAPVSEGTAYSVAVAGNVKGEAYSELILVDAPAARFARRIARAQLREAGIDTTNLVFNARIVR